MRPSQGFASDTSGSREPPSKDSSDQSKTKSGESENEDQLVDSIFGAWPQRPQSMDPADDQTYATTIGERRQELTRAVEILDNLTVQYPERPAYALQLARVLRERSIENDPATTSRREPSRSEAVEILKQLHREYPNNARVRWELISVLFHWDVFRESTQEQMDHMIKQLQKASELIDDLVSKYPGIDEYIARQSQIDFRLEVLVQRTADSLDRRHRMEVDYQSSVAFRRAVDASASLVRRNPNAAGYRAWHATFLMWLGESLIRIGEPKDAITQLNQAVENWKVVDEQSGTGPSKLGLDQAEQMLVDLLRF